MSVKTIETCLSPELIHLYALEGKVVVVIDIFRATSVMITALGEGVKHIRPFATVDPCKEMKASGYLIAGERGGVPLEGFDLGNSPLAYLNKKYDGAHLAMTTTNGTLALQKSIAASAVVIGGFLNFNALIDFIKSSDRSVVLHCAGWKGKFNFEDTLFAGAVVSKTSGEFEACDASVMAADLYLSKERALLDFLLNSSHVRRLTKINAEIAGDIKHCCAFDLYQGVPFYKDGFLTYI